MKFFLAIVFALLITDPKKIARINAIKKEAERAFLLQEYELALAKYSLLRDSLDVDDPAIDLNLAHAHYHLGDTASAKTNYGKLTSSDNNQLKSIAYQQIGVINKDMGKLEESLQQLKSAIKANPANQEARYNYEVVKKLLEEQQKQDQNQDQQNKDGEDENEQQNKDQQQENEKNKDQQGNEENKDQQQENEENKDGENQEKSEEEKQQEQQKKEGEEEQQEQEKSQEQMTQEKLEEMGISEEKVRQLLEAMRQSEIKYLQYQRRKPTKRPPSGKPDW